MKRTLYFEGAGLVPRGDVENCRIRTAYRNRNGEIVYLEIISGNKAYRKVEDKKGKRKIEEITGAFGHVDFAFIVKPEKTAKGETVWTDCNRVPTRYEKPPKKDGFNYAFEYTKAEILRIVNTYFDGNFDEIVVLPDLAGYRVHRKNAYDGGCPYNLMDDFVYDIERTKQAQKIKQYFYDFEKNVLKKKYPNNSVYFEDGVLKVLMHYNGLNDRLQIENVFEYEFNYTPPVGATVVK